MAGFEARGASCAPTGDFANFAADVHFKEWSEKSWAGAKAEATELKIKLLQTAAARKIARGFRQVPSTVNQ